MGVSIKYYHFQLVVARYTKAVQVSNSVEFCYQHITQPTLTNEDIILDGMNTISFALTDAPTVAYDSQLRAITYLRDLFRKRAEPLHTSTEPPQPNHHKLHSCMTKLRKRGKRRNFCQPPTPQLKTRPPDSPPRIHRPELAV